MQLHLYGVISLGILVAGAVGSAALGHQDLAMVLVGCAAGTLVPQLFRSKQ